MTVESPPTSLRNPRAQLEPADSVSASPTNADLIKMLNHPMRRAILRFLLKVPAANSTEILQAIAIFGATTSLVNFHLDILVKGAAASRKAVAGHEYVYAARDSVRREWLDAVLRLTAEEE